MPVGKKRVLGGRESVKVAIVQKASRFLDKEASLERAEAYIAEAAATGAELIVFPEVWLAGYPYWTEGWDSSLQAWVGGRLAFRDAAVLAPSEDTERLGAAARRANAYVVMGCNEIDPAAGSQHHLQHAAVLRSGRPIDGTAPQDHADIFGTAVLGAGRCRRPARF